MLNSPPAEAFWSFTLCYTENGFSIPNDHKKYRVGENGGMKLNDEGDIGIHIAAEQPEGVPEENWLPLNRDDYGIDLLIWLYLPDLDKFKTWNASKAEILTSPRAKQEKVKRPQSILAAPKSRTSYGARISTWPRRMSSTRTLFYTRKYRVADLVLAAAEQIESERKFVGR